MASTDVVVEIKTEGADQAIADLKKVEKQQAKVNKEAAKGETDYQAFADVLDELGVSGAGSLFGIGRAVNETTSAFNGLRGAMLASGVGILLTVLPEVIEGFKGWFARVSDTRGAHERLHDVMEAGNEVYAKDIEILQQEKEAMEEFGIATKETTAAYNEQISALQRKGRIEAIREEITLLQERLDKEAHALADSAEQVELQKQQRTETEQAIELLKEQLNLEIGRQKAAEGGREIAEQLRKDYFDQLDAEKKLNEQRIADRAKDLENQKEHNQKQIDELVKHLDEYNRKTTEARDKRREDELNSIRTVRGRQAEATDEDLRQFTTAEEAKQHVVAGSMAFLQGIQQLFGENSAAGKAAAIAQIAAETALGLAAAVPVALEAAKYAGPAAPLIYGATYAGIAGSVFSVAAQAKQILEGGGGGGGGSVIGAVSGPQQQQFLVPQTPQAPGLTTPEPVQAVVLEQEITNSQALQNELRLRSSL